ncbi:MAG: hypothetical protein WBP12_03510 [Candidatus Saccharimonas sp.]
MSFVARRNQRAAAHPRTHALWWDSNRDGNYELYAGSLTANTQIRQTNDTSFNSFWPVPNPVYKHLILFERSLAAANPHDDASNVTGIWVLNTNTGQTTEIINRSNYGWAWLRHGEWSPDGTKIACMWANGSGDNGFAVFTFNVTTLEATFSTVPFSTNLSIGFIRDCAWSPDGNKIISCADITGNPSLTGIWLSNATDASNNTVLFAGSDCYDPYFSPDGSKIAFLRQTGFDQLGTWAIQLVDANGANLTTVIDDGNINSKPAWASNSRLYFHRLRYYTDTAFELWAIDTNGNNLTQLTTSDGFVDEYPRPVGS